MTAKKMSGHELRVRISKEFRKRINGHPLTYSHPVLTAKSRWDFIKDNLQAVLGDNIYDRWFAEVRPIVLTNGTLILKTRDQFSVHWINKHYQATVDALLSVFNDNAQSFFICEDDMGGPKMAPSFHFREEKVQANAPVR